MAGHEQELSRIYLSPPHMSGQEQQYIDEAFASNWIAPVGPHIEAFERELAAYVGCRDAAAVSSGTAAIQLALHLLGVSSGDRVFCSSFTFTASANPIRYLGGEPVFIDSEADTWNMSPLALERALKAAANAGKLPKAVVVVHLYGQCAKMDEIGAICEAYEVPIVEDAAEALGSTYKGRSSGTFGRLGIFSFNGNKIITTSGGGMLVSDDESLLAKARFLATQARDQALHYQHSAIGYNFRMSNVLAGIGRAQLEVLDDRVQARRAVFARYAEALQSRSGIAFMPEWREGVSNRWLTALTIDQKETGVTISELLSELGDRNIEARPLWKPLHQQPVYSGTAFYSAPDDEPVCERLFKTGICLPSGSSLKAEEQMRVIGCIEGLLDGAKCDNDAKIGIH